MFKPLLLRMVDIRYSVIFLSKFGVNQMVPLFINFHPEATLNRFHFTPPPFTSCVLSAEWQQIVCCELRLNYLCPQINLSLIPLQLFLSNTNANIVEQIFWKKENVS